MVWNELARRLGLMGSGLVGRVLWEVVFFLRESVAVFISAL